MGTKTSIEKAEKTLWYVAFRENGDWDWHGPFTRDEVISQLTRREIIWADFVFSPDKPGRSWERLCNLPEFGEDPFQGAPKVPPQDLIKEITRAARDLTQGGSPNRVRAIWYIKHEKSEFGPLTPTEARTVLKSGKLKGEVLVRRSGSSTWKPAESTFTIKFLPEPPPKSNDVRRSPRAPLVATVQYSPGGNKKAAKPRTGACRDISIHGMLILSTNHPVIRGSVVWLDVEPNPESGISPFKTEAIVVWTNPGDTAFSVEFRNPPYDTLLLIQKYTRKKGKL